MARYNEIYVGHFNRFVQKLTGIKGGPPSPQLAGDFQPVINAFVGAEGRYLAAWNNFGNFQDVPAAVGLTGGVQIRNPAGSNVIAVVERIYVACSTATIRVSLSQPSGAQLPFITDLGSAGAAIRANDRRAGDSLSSVLIISSQNSPSVGSLNSVFLQTFTTTAFFPLDLLFPVDSSELPLLPGDAIRVSIGSANVEVLVGFQWRERFIEESERI